LLTCLRFAKKPRPFPGRRGEISKNTANVTRGKLKPLADYSHRQRDAFRTAATEKSSLGSEDRANEKPASKKKIEDNADIANRGPRRDICDIISKKAIIYYHWRLPPKPVI
jgi:hypothetical protein